MLRLPASPVGPVAEGAAGGSSSCDPALLPEVQAGESLLSLRYNHPHPPIPTQSIEDAAGTLTPFSLHKLTWIALKVLGMRSGCEVVCGDSGLSTGV